MLEGIDAATSPGWPRNREYLNLSLKPVFSSLKPVFSARAGQITGIAPGELPG